jgi:membrane protein
MKPVAILLLIRDIMLEANRWRSRSSKRHVDDRSKNNAPRPALRSGPQHSQAEIAPPTKPSAAPEAQANAVGPHTGSPLKPANLFALLRNTLADWNADRAPQLAAALAYYTVFSMAPLLIVVIAITGLAFGHEAAQNQIVSQLQGMVGTEGAKTLQDMIQNANKPAQGILATVIGLVTLLLGAAGAFGQMKAALNIIWNVPVSSAGGIKGILVNIKTTLISLTMVLGIGFLLLVSLVLSAILAALSNFVGDRLPLPPVVWHVIDFVVSFGIITLLFAAIYKVLPDANIAWNDVWIGAAMTSLLFVVGKILIGLYLGHSTVASSYGAAGSLVVLLLWIYYSAQILFFGAEFTQVYANRYGSHISYRNVAPAQSAASDQKQKKPQNQQPLRV